VQAFERKNARIPPQPDVHGAQGDKPFLGSGLFRGKQKSAWGIALHHHGNGHSVDLDNLVVRTIDEN
jgi:hypothetical protein